MAENNSQTRMFVPIPDNPLHLASSFKKPLFLSPSPSPPLASASLQKKTSLKDDTPSSNNIKHTVRWTSPISISRMIPSRESGPINLHPKTAIPTQQISIPWSISQSITLNECTQCEPTTLLELDSHFFHWEKKGSSSVLSFSRPRALLSQSEELHARINLMHLQTVILPKILSFSISTNPNPLTKKYPSKTPTNTKTLQCRVTNIGRNPVFRPATSLNIPRHQRTDQYDSPHRRLKRRSTTPDYKRPRKVAKRDENTSAAASRQSDAPDPEQSINQSLDPWTSGAGRSSSAEPPSSNDDPSDDDDDDDEALSDSGSLFGDHELLEREVPVRNDCSHSGNVQTQGPRRPLNIIKVVNWTNGLNRFQYLLQKNKMDWRCDDELYELLKGIDVDKDNITIELLKKTQVGKIIRDLSKCDEFEKRSRILATRIYHSWRTMCRAVKQ